MKNLSEYLPFWEKLTDAQRAELTEQTKRVSYKKGQTVYSTADKCLGMLIILEGDLRAYLLSDEGKEVTLYRLSSGNLCVMTASCVLKGITFDVFVDAETDCDALLINAALFQTLVSDNVFVENFALKTAVERFSDVVWSMEQMLFFKFEVRLASFLLDETARLHSDEIPLTHEQIAKFIGSAREVVSRTLKIFEKKGAVQTANGKITVLNADSLRKICQF